MKATYNWLKDFVELKITPQVLADKLTMAGLEVTSLQEKYGDFIFEIEITSNRPDWLSIMGIAREIAAITNSKLKTQNSQFLSAKRYPLNAKTLTINIEDKKDCPLYTAKIIRDVKVTVSPDWLKKRLELIGCHSVNNIVDITNYILFETGQPLHAFDLDKLIARQPQGIVVRRAKKDEGIITIDCIKRILAEDILVIATDSGSQTGDRRQATGVPIAIAGIMGGKDTEVTEKTKNILLEAAVFNPIVVRRGRQKLGLQSESSYRFERGINLEIVETASSMAAGLMQEIAGGKCVLGKSSRQPQTKMRSIGLEIQNVDRFLGINIATGRIKKILTSLGFKTALKSKNSLTVKVPLYRQDVKLEIDLIEEIARISGYETLPKTLPKIKPHLTLCTKWELSSLIKNILIGLGLDEVITYSLIDKELLVSFEKEPLGAIEILNPLSREQEILRSTIVPSLASCVAYNLNQKQEHIGIFELANVFRQNQAAPYEELVLGICLCGTKSLLLQQGLIKEEVGFLHLKGITEELLGRLGIGNYSFELKDSPCVITISMSQQKIGTMVKLEKGMLDKVGIKNKDVFALELSLERIFPYTQLKKRFLPLPKYPASTRDISFVLREDISITEVLSAIKEKGKPLLDSVKVVDYYKGKQIPPGHRSLAISCLYRSDERTLVDEEINSLHALICGLLTERFRANIR